MPRLDDWNLKDRAIINPPMKLVWEDMAERINEHLRLTKEVDEAFSRAVNCTSHHRYMDKAIVYFAADGSISYVDAHP